MVSRVKIRYAVICKTSPEFSKRDGTLYTCTLGISPELGLIRVYPVPPTGMVKWGVYEFEVERNPRDTRQESWKMSSMSRKEGWSTLSNDVKVVGSINEDYAYKDLSKHIMPSISKMNEHRLSIGVLKPIKFLAKWHTNKNHVDNSQLPLFDDVGIDVEKGSHVKYMKADRDKELRILFNDMDGLHDLQFNEWHYYEGQRSYGAKNELLRPLNDNTRDLLLIGNMHSYRNTWLGLGKFKGTFHPVLF